MSLLQEIHYYTHNYMLASFSGWSPLLPQQEPGNDAIITLKRAKPMLPESTHRKNTSNLQRDFDLSDSSIGKKISIDVLQQQTSRGQRMGELRPPNPEPHQLELKNWVIQRYTYSWGEVTVTHGYIVEFLGTVLANVQQTIYM